KCTQNLFFSSTTTTTVTNNGTKETTITTTQTLRSLYSVYSPTKTTETKTVTSSSNMGKKKRAEDQLYDTLLPRSITSAAKSVSSFREPSSSFSTRRTSSLCLTRSYSSYTDDSPTTRTTSYTISSSRPSFSLSSYSGVSSPTTTISTRLSRILQEKDLCTQCRKPFDGSAKMVLPEMKINCHATCFKCEVCNSTLGQMKAGDSLWIYRSMVHCENCFDITREKWRH
uniref:LIM zinc-binding domain-containing protein n=1 Tax=Tetraodon nigroviridis TaxID=99883 RepID=H3BZ99_TETNG